MRSVTLPSGRRIILSDTVGFISDLPTELIAAFRATLEEVAEADVIVHVRNVAHPDSDAQREDVIQVLNNLVRDGVLGETWPERVVEVLNKSDILGGVRHVAHVGGAVPVSALTQEGLPDLLSAIDAQLTAHLPSSTLNSAFRMVPPWRGFMNMAMSLRERTRKRLFV